MENYLSQYFKTFQHNRTQLHRILKDTQCTLEFIHKENFFPGEDIIKELLPSSTINEVKQLLKKPPAIVIVGQDNKAKASLVNNLLSKDILPLSNDDSWRWVKFIYGCKNHVRLTLGEYEVVERPQANEQPWNTLPIEDLIKPINEEDIHFPTVLEVVLNQEELKEEVQLFIVPNNGSMNFLASLEILPIFLYALSDQPLTKENLEELRDLKDAYPYNAILFISSLLSISLDITDVMTEPELTESEQHNLQNQVKVSKNDILNDNVNVDKMNSLGLTWLDQLSSLGFLSIEESTEAHQLAWFIGKQYIDKNSSDLVDSCKKMDRIFHFTRSSLQNYLIKISTYLNEMQTNSLRKFILSAFDMARKIQITPKRIHYAEKKENELYTCLMKVVNEKQIELTDLIQSIIQKMKDSISKCNDIYQYQAIPFDIDASMEWRITTPITTISDIQRFILNRLSEKVTKELVNSINCLREQFIGTLERCLISLEKTYDYDSNSLASSALKQMLSIAYNVQLHNSSPTLIHSFLERLRHLFKSLPLPWTPPPTLDAAWRKKVSIDILNSLSAARLAKTISTQFKDKLKSSHDAFHTALRSLEDSYSGKLERTEEQRRTIRKYYTPKLATLALESMSMKDVMCFGKPHFSKEIGRGQYGVVYACDSWKGAPGPCAVKSVIPPDERLWDDLAMEVYYTRSIPAHKRIVKLRGSIIDTSYGGGYGSGVSVLLITDRFSRDLYSAIYAGIPWAERTQITIDVLEGIRYLHSQGLVHRDIKLKNVLLDSENRAKLTDFGFCITEAMISGSVVGTPVHMAPELLSGHYDSSVDIYAFGILFWYICANRIRLPDVYDQFNSKEQLWNSVRKGLRPVRLPHFDDECWELMQQCWSGDPSKRPLLGAIQPILESIHQKAKERGKLENDAQETSSPEQLNLELELNKLEFENSNFNSNSNSNSNSEERSSLLSRNERRKKSYRIMAPFVSLDPIFCPIHSNTFLQTFEF